MPTIILINCTVFWGYVFNNDVSRNEAFEYSYINVIMLIKVNLLVGYYTNLNTK